MGTREIPFLLSAVLGLTGSTRAQNCGPISLTFAGTGPACTPAGGTVPALTAAASSSPSGCYVFVAMTPPFFPPLPPAFLIVGTVNPAFDLASIGLPGCVLWASPSSLLPMPLVVQVPVGPAYFFLDLPVPPDPALAGATVFLQGLLFVQTGTTPPVPRLSNGISLSFS